MSEPYDPILHDFKDCNDGGCRNCKREEDPDNQDALGEFRNAEVQAMNREDSDE